MYFEKYMHLEKFGTDEVQGIDLGTVYVFPKLDGTNASVWGDDNGVCAGSRRRELDIHNDNAGFCNWVLDSGFAEDLLTFEPNLRLFGEWLVPHSLKTYREDAWRKFYVFDVYDDAQERFLAYDEYKPILDRFGIDYLPPLAIIKNPTYEQLLNELENNVYLIQEGKGVGEGIVIKNYEFENRFGRVCWAKIVTNSFKEKHAKEMGAPEKQGKKMVEYDIVDNHVTLHLVEKVYAKIVNEVGSWTSKLIPRLLQTVWYDLVKEDAWEFVKKHRNPTINFRTLNTLAIRRVKELKPELF